MMRGKNVALHPTCTECYLSSTLRALQSDCRTKLQLPYLEGHLCSHHA